MGSFTEAQAMYKWSERIRDEKLPAVSYMHTQSMNIILIAWVCQYFTVALVKRSYYSVDILISLTL